MWLVPVAFAAFPALSGEDLSGTPVAFPSGLRAEKTLLILAWQREQQTVVDTWLPLARQLDAAIADFDYLQVPVIPELPSLVRFTIVAGMRSGLPTSEHAHVATLFTDPVALKAALGLSGEEVRALLVKRDGTVGWQGMGTLDAAESTSLTTLLGVSGP